MTNREAFILGMYDELVNFSTKTDAGLVVYLEEEKENLKTAFGERLDKFVKEVFDL